MQTAPATLSVTPNNHTSSSSSSSNHNPYAGIASHSLEEATEFEYLRNILFQYMLGKQSMTLAKVLATVVKFDKEQVKQIVAHEEKRQGVLAGLGIYSSS